MPKNLTFADWIEKSPNNAKDKPRLIKYIRALRSKAKKIMPIWSFFSGGVLFDLMDVPIDKSQEIISEHEDFVINKLRKIYYWLNRLKSGGNKFHIVFGDEFVWSKYGIKIIDPEREIIWCQMAIDQYARFLRGVDSGLAKLPAYTRNYYETNYSITPRAGNRVLVLRNDWDKMKTMANEYRRMQDALNTKSFLFRHKL